MTKLSLLRGAGGVALVFVLGSHVWAQTPDAPVPAPELDPNDEVVVTSTRSSIENSIRAKQNADSIIDSLSADDADRFPDNNIGEALARIPGISFQRDNDSGDGEFISIRGLDAQFNTVLHNGIRTGTSDTFRRTALDVVTGNNVSSIDVIKAPLPEHASEGIGGIVDIRTRGALDRRERTTVHARIEDNSFAEKNGYRIGATTTKRLSDTVGINLSASYRKRYIESFQINPATTVPDRIGDIVLNDINGNPVTFTSDGPLALVPTEFIDISNFNTEQINYTHDDIERDQYTISGNIDWQFSDTTKITFGGRHDDVTDIQQANTMEFDVDNSFVGGVNTWRDPEVNFRSSIEDEEETESRLFLRTETELEKWDISFVGGWSRAFRDLPFTEINFVQELEDVPSSPGTGASDERAITYAPFDLSNVDGLFPAPVPLNDVVFLEALDPFCQDGGGSCGELFDYNHEQQDSRENTRWAANLDFRRDFSGHDFLDNIKFGGAWERSEFSDIDIDVTTSDDSLGQNGMFAGTDAGPNSISADSNIEIGELGLVTTDVISFDRIGNPFASSGFVGLPRFDGTRLRQLNDDFLRDFLASGQDPLSREVIEAEENFFAAYAQAKFTFDKLDIVGGLRVEYYEGEFSGPFTLSSSVVFDDGMGGQDVQNLQAPQTAAVVTTTDNFEVLPRIAFNYNLSDEIKLRASYTTALSRPTFDLLAGTVDGRFDIELAGGVALANATINDVVAVDTDFQLGNPNLRNAYAKSFDLSFEYYSDSQNAFSAAVFYKEIDDFIFNSFATDGEVNSAPADNPGAVFDGADFSGVQGFDLITQLGGFAALNALPFATNNIQQARNGEKAEIYGIELGVFHTMDYLPGILSNLGFIGNATFTESETTINLGQLTASDAYVQLGYAQAGDALIQEFPFFNSPEAIYNATLFFDYKGFEANLSYRNSGVQLEEIEAFGISQYQQGRTFIDLDLEYTFRDVGAFDRITVYFEGSDLTDTGQKPSVFETRGLTRAFNDNSTFNGRTFRFGTRFRF